MIQRPFRSGLVSFGAIIVAVTTLGFSHWSVVRKSGRALQLYSRRGLIVVAIDGKESPNGRLASKSKEAYDGHSEQSPRNNNTTHRFRVKRSHLFKEKMSKFASRYRTDQTNNSQKMEHYLSGAKRIVGGTAAARGDYPTFVFSAGEQLCGATLIWYDVLLTAVREHFGVCHVCLVIH
jgi:hypothetical protein